jgi:hypothetical protein
MSSKALRRWNLVDQAALKEIEDVHAKVGGTARGRRFTTAQINQAYTVLLVARFQSFCRNLHSEGVDHLTSQLPQGPLHTVFRNALFAARKLDRGNPNPGNIGADFAAFGFDFWPAVALLDSNASQRRLALQELNDWRNAIAHQDFDPGRLGQKTLQLVVIRRWRRTCQQLALSIDEVLRQQLHVLTGVQPW